MVYQLGKRRYDEIEEEVNRLFEDLGFTEYPVDPFEMARRLNIEVKRYSEIPKDVREMLVSKFEDGYGLLIQKMKYVICYNDKIIEERIRFTLWYEIGHIQLGHYDEDCKKSPNVMKAEANAFARYAIAAMPFVFGLEPYACADIARVFGTSGECAEHIYGAYLNANRWFSVKNKILSNRILRIMKFKADDDLADIDF